MNKYKTKDFDLLPTVMALMLLVPLSIFGAYAVSLIWGLFLVPAGLPRIGVLPAWGFVACAALAASNPGDGKDWGPLVVMFARAVQIVVALGIAYLVHAVFA